jgi:hypothetical protein
MGDIIKMVIQDVGWSSMDWTDLARVRDRWRALVNAIKNIRVPRNAWKLLTK